MRALLAVFFSLLGAVAGYLAAFLLGYPLLVALEGRDMNGGIAMGVAVGLGPLCAVIGAIGALLLTLRILKPKAKPALPVPDDPIEAVDQVLLTGDPSKKQSMFDTQALVAVGLVVVLIATVWIWLFDDGAPPHFPVNGPRPVMQFELRVPASAIIEDDRFRIRAELRSWEHSISARRDLQRTNGANGETVLGGSVELHDKVAARSLQVWLSPLAMLEFNLNYAEVPDAEDAFGEWRPVDRIHSSRDGTTDEHPADAGYYIRTRMTWPGSR